MSTVHQFPVTSRQRHRADALGVAIDAAVGSRQLRGREAAALARMRPRDSSWSALLAIADFGTHVEVDGVIYQRHEPGVVRYFTLCGAVDIERWTYREMGVRNGPTLVPLDLDAGLVERTTPALGFRIALGYAKDHMTQLRGGYDGRPPMSALAKHAGTGGQGHRDRGHAGGASHRTAPAARSGCRTAQSHLTGPRPHVGAHEEDVPAGETPATASRRAYALHTQEASPGECQLPVAYVDTISFHDADGNLATRRYTAAAHESPTDRCADVADLRHALRQVPALAVGVIQDGEPELWNSCARPLWPTAGHGRRSDRPVSSHRALANVLRYGRARRIAGRGCLGGTRASTALTTPSIASAHESRDRSPTPSPGRPQASSSS